VGGAHPSLEGPERVFDGLIASEEKSSIPAAFRREFP
jgi:hypothetical protein